MNSKKIIGAFFLTIFIIGSYVTVHSQDDAKKDPSQRLTTPPMQLTESTTPSNDKVTTPPSSAPTPSTPAASPSPSSTPPAPPQGDIKKTTPLPAGQPALPPAGQASPSGTVQYAPTMLKTTTNYEFIIDASGSMNGSMEMRKKLDIVKAALKEVISEKAPLDIKRNMGLRTYGAGSPLENNDCQDTKLEAPVEQTNIPLITKTIDSITAQGQSPLAAALTAAEKDFPVRSDADNIIILIADGGDACNVDVCQVAAKLQQGPKKIMVQVIGFDVDQKAQESMLCIAKNSSGQFNLARNEAELKSMLDQAVNSTLPYNLRVKIAAGTKPITATLTVLKAGTQQVVQEDKSSGIKFYKLAPGTYDIKVVYTDSLESNKPTKLLKNVEVQETSKAEQVVEFNLGQITVSAIDQNGQPTEASFQIKKGGTEATVATFTSGPDPMTFSLTPGSYDISTEMKSKDGLVLNMSEKNLAVRDSESLQHEFRFQTGKLSLKGTDVAGQPIPMVYKITEADSDKEVTSGEAPKEGVVLELAPARYDVYVQLQEPDVERVPQTKLESVEIKGGETAETIAKIATGTLKLSGKDSKGQLIKTNYEIKIADTGDIVAKTRSDAMPKLIHLAPGKYDIMAFDASSGLTPPPSIQWSSVEVKEGETLDREATFLLGTLKVATMNSKHVLIPGNIVVYRAGSDEELAKVSTEATWKDINLTPGLYDIKAEDAKSKQDPKPNVWFHDISVVPNQSIAKEAVFINGKLKLLCQGSNNSIINCQFNVFSYGKDRPMISGETGKNWVDYEILPGKYYMEAGWHDPVGEVLLKKWINISVEENQILEEIIRF